VCILRIFIFSVNYNLTQLTVLIKTFTRRARSNDPISYSPYSHKTITILSLRYGHSELGFTKVDSRLKNYNYQIITRTITQIASLTL